MAAVCWTCRPWADEIWSLPSQRQLLLQLRRPHSLEVEVALEFASNLYSTFDEEFDRCSIEACRDVQRHRFLLGVYLDDAILGDAISRCSGTLQVRRWLPILCRTFQDGDRDLFLGTSRTTALGSWW